MLDTETKRKIDSSKDILLGKIPDPSIYLDQNIREKMSKKSFKLESFQNNVNSLIGKNIQRFTAFGLLEFAGLKKTELFDIPYKGQKLNEYPFQNYQDVLDCQYILKKQIRKKITKDFLIEKLEKKRKDNEPYLNEQGFQYIETYITSVQLMYEGLIDNLLLDRLSQLNISKLCPEDKKKVIYFFVDRVIGIISQKRNLGGLRLICKIFKERKGNIVEGKQSKIIEEQIIEICGKLKSKGDLMDCELVHLAFFGSNKKRCHCYTTDDEKTINKRLELYCKSTDFLIDWYCKSSNTYTKNNGYNPPKLGKVFILDKNTGKINKEISTTEIYENYLDIRT